RPETGSDKSARGDGAGLLRDRPQSSALGQVPLPPGPAAVLTGPTHQQGTPPLRLSRQNENEVPAKSLKSRKACQQSLVDPLQRRRQPARTQYATDHGQELKSTDGQVRKDSPQRPQITGTEGMFIRGAAFAGVGQTGARPVEQWVAAPRLAEDGSSAGPQHPA